MKTVFSGIKPTGKLALGNYLGTFKEWAKLQEEYNCIFSVVDLHSLTVRNEPSVLKENSRSVIMLYLASGIDPVKSTIYYQSQVKAHAQLGWILGCYTYMGELNRMTQFKEKSQISSNINSGLFTYPVLQAADILLYNTHFVPVGEDQRQHIELAREIALRFNNIYGDIFVIPETMALFKLTARLKGLQNPHKKMDKSTTDFNDTIFLLDTDKEITKKIKSAVTDSENHVYYDPETKPGISNLLAIYSAITKKSLEESQKDFEGKNYGYFKTALAEVVVDELRPLKEKYEQLSADTEYVDNVIKTNAEKAAAVADVTLAKVCKALGLG